MPERTNKSITILGIETSCDETSAAVFKEGKILANQITTQMDHARYGGVVPELASRAHQRLILPVIESALELAGCTVQDVDAIAYTRGPGLMGSLLVGSSFAKGLSLATRKPLFEVNHMEAHILAHFIDDPRLPPAPEFPFLCLTVSGGHTQLVLVKSHLIFEVVGETMDDAAGEAFDKAAKLLGLPYPGGPVLDRHARNGNPEKWKFARPKVNGLDFSFSGLKTSILYFLQDKTRQDEQFIKDNLDDLCASVQHTIVEILIAKFKQAITQTGVSSIALSGGVSANSGLRSAVVGLAKKLNLKLHLLPLEFCTDNAAMIAVAGYYKFVADQKGNLSSAPLARFPVG